MTPPEIIPFMPSTNNNDGPITIDEFVKYVEDEHLIDYCSDLAEKIWVGPDPENEGNYCLYRDPIRFCIRFSGREIDNSRVEKYRNSEELQDTLRAFNLDASRFWYLCLFVKDVVDGETIDVRHSNDSPFEEICNLINAIEEMKIVLTNIGLDANSSKKGELSMRLEGDRHLLKINNPRTLLAIKEALIKYKESIREDSILKFGTLAARSGKNSSTIHRVYLFHQYLKEFVSNLKADKKIYASKDKNLLISRMIFILGINDSEDFYEDYNEKGEKRNYLKNYLHNYKPPRSNNINIYYW